MKNTQLAHAAHVAHAPAAALLPLRLLAHDVAIAANVGALFRLADALGVEHLHLAGTSARPPDPKIRRTARSADRFVAHSVDPDALAVVAHLRADGWRVVALELTTASVDVGALPIAPGERLCLVVGAEDAGVSQALLDAVDSTVHIPMRGRNSSMNVATACAIAVYEIARKLQG